MYLTIRDPILFIPDWLVLNFFKSEKKSLLDQLLLDFYLHTIDFKLISRKIGLVQKSQLLESLILTYKN